MTSIGKENRSDAYFLKNSIPFFFLIKAYSTVLSIHVLFSKSYTVRERYSETVSSIHVLADQEAVYSKAVSEAVYSKAVSEAVYSKAVSEAVYSKAVKKPCTVNQSLKPCTVKLSRSRVQ